MSTLYVVATPIGNLRDITLRALDVLRDVSLIAAEDTRKSRTLLKHHGVATPLVAYHEQGGAGRASPIVRRLDAGADVALVTDAGTPTISDPGYGLIEAVLHAGHCVEAVPGPSALTSALAVAGLPNDQFVYLGFLPRRHAQRLQLLTATAHERRTIVAFEAPHRLRASLADLLQALGDRRLSVARELTKLHEEVFRGTIAAALDHFTAPRGEFTLVVAGADSAATASATPTAAVLSDLSRLRERGLGAREAVALVAGEHSLPRRAVYRAWLASEAGTDRPDLA